MSEYQNLLKEFTASRIKPVYLISSEEVFFLDRIADFLCKNLIPLEMQDFNLTVLYGREIQASGVIDQARAFPFMGDKRLILVKSAHDVKDWELLSSYAKKPNESSVMVLLFGKKPDGRSSWVKTLKENGFYHELKGIPDYQLHSFVNQMINEAQLKIDDEALRILVEFVGNDLSGYYNELEKLKLNLGSSNKITPDFITEYVGLNKEFNVFELQKAISVRNTKNIYWIAKNMGSQSKRNPIFMTLGALLRHFQKIWIAKRNIKLNDDELSKILKLPFKSFVKEYREAASLYSITGLENAFSVLKKFDLKAKGVDSVSATEEDLYIELAISISHL